MNFLNSNFGVITSIVLFAFMPIILKSKFSKNKIIFGGLIYIIGLGNSIAEILGNRSLTFMSDSTTESIYIVTDPIKIRAYEAFTFFSFYFILLAILLFFLNNNGKLLIEQNNLLLWGGLLIFSFGMILSNLIGAKPVFKENYLLMPLIFSALIFYLPADYDWALIQIKNVLLIIIYGSILSLLISPNWAAAPYNTSWIPGVTTRLFGLTSHPNALGPIAILYLLISQLKHLKNKKWLEYFHQFAALFVLVYAQSKTAWVAGVVAFVVLFFYRSYQSRFSGKYSWKIIIGVILLFLGLSFFLVFYEKFLTFLGTNPTITSLTGRTKVWEITWQTFLQNPWFGYGPNLWNLDFRLEHGAQFLFAGQSHNQFIHVMAESGGIGFSFFVCYIIILLKTSISSNKLYFGVPFAFVVFMIIRSITETPFRSIALDNNFFMHMTLFVVVAYGAKKMIYENECDKE